MTEAEGKAAEMAKFSGTFIAMCSSSEDGETASIGCFATFEIVKYILEKFRCCDKGWN